MPPKFEDFLLWGVTPYVVELTRHYLSGQYAEQRASIETRLREDKRVVNLIGSMIRPGSGAYRIEFLSLTLWMLKRSYDVGPETAWGDLDRFLKGEIAKFDLFLLLVGTQIEKEIEFDKDVSFIPCGQLPESTEKIEALIPSWSNLGGVRPGGALRVTVDMPKIYPETDNFVIDESTAAFQKLSEIALLVNATRDLFCFPAKAFGFPKDDVPCGVFGGGGSSIVLSDFVPIRSCSITEDYIPALRESQKLFSGVSDVDKRILSDAIRRFGSAKAWSDASQAALDLGIATEMLLLGGERKSQELPDSLSMHFRTRGAWLIGRDANQRKEAYGSLRDIYAARSQVAHAGKLSGKNAIGPKHYDVVSEIIAQILSRGSIPNT